MDQTTDHTPAPVTLRACVVCDVQVIGGIAVGLIESGSGPGHVLHACRRCVAYKNLLPLDEQETVHGDGRLQFRSQ